VGLKIEEDKAIERAYDHFMADKSYFNDKYVTASNIAGVIARCLEPVRSAWRVIGITKAALDAFENVNFDKPSVKIQRAHLKDRKTVVCELLQKRKLNFEEFKKKVIGKDDHCILGLSSENKSIKNNQDTIIYFKKNVGDFDIEDNDPLFQTKGYCWRYKDKEKEFLKDLSSNMSNKR